MDMKQREDGVHVSEDSQRTVRVQNMKRKARQSDTAEANVECQRWNEPTTAGPPRGLGTSSTLSALAATN
jgi:hypothetical protein